MHEPSGRAAAAAYIARNRKRPTCATCHDTGEVRWNPSRINDPACEQSAPCPDCEDTP